MVRVLQTARPIGDDEEDEELLDDAVDLAAPAANPSAAASGAPALGAAPAANPSAAASGAPALGAAAAARAAPAIGAAATHAAPALGAAPTDVADLGASGGDLGTASGKDKAAPADSETAGAGGAGGGGASAAATAAGNGERGAAAPGSTASDGDLGDKPLEGEPRSGDGKFAMVKEFVDLAKKCDHRELLEYLQESDDAAVVELLDRNASMAALASGILSDRMTLAGSGSSSGEVLRLRRENASLREEQASLRTINTDFQDQLTKRDEALAALKELIQSHEEEITGLRAGLKAVEEEKVAAQERAKNADDACENLKRVSQKLAQDFAKGASDIHACLTEILDKFGGEPNPLPAVPGLVLPGDFLGWLKGELGYLPGVLDNVGYFSAKTGCFALLDLLEKRGCQHFPDFGRGSYPEANFGMVDTNNDSKSVRVVLSRFMRCYWRAYGVLACRRFAERQFEEMRLKLQGASKDAAMQKRPPSAHVEELLAKTARVEGSGSADDSTSKAPLDLKAPRNSRLYRRVTRKKSSCF
ncbi:hypothetical protein EJB05_14930, partial [Eragrostis curvula]